MTTKRSGGKITGLLALTFEAQEALEVGDWVHVIGDYEVERADGTKPVVGTCSVHNVKATNTSMSRTVGVPNVPGDVTIEVRGYFVATREAEGAITAGTLVGIGADGVKFQAAGAGVSNVGIALMTVADGEDCDVLVQ